MIRSGELVRTAYGSHHLITAVAWRNRQARTP
ncbi:hypothetical protein QFZ68_006582 [Streptomyces sp. V1I6]|nr:hypothetical protein [Streptomyces sp. V1I6]